MLLINMNVTHLNYFKPRMHNKLTVANEWLVQVL